MNPLNDPAKFHLKTPDILQGVNPTALSKLVRLQEAIGKPLTITSGYRDAKVNAEAGGVKHSQHLDANAIDIKMPGASATDTANLIKEAALKIDKSKFPSGEEFEVETE
jgi:uncharacterized protein YcbK (DUF882 family)